MIESPLAQLSPEQLKSLVDLNESGGFQLLLSILGEDLKRSTEGLKVIGNPDLDLQRLAHWRGQAHTTQFLQNLPAVVEFENKRRDELETAMMNQGEIFHNPHPSVFEKYQKMQAEQAAMAKVAADRECANWKSQNPFVVK